MKTKEIIEKLSEYPDDLEWEIVIDEDEGVMLVSEYTGDISNAQIAIVIDNDQFH